MTRHRRKRISPRLLATIARSRLSMPESKRSSSKQLTETNRESLSSHRQESKLGNSLVKGYLTGIYKSKKTGNTERFESSYELRRFQALDRSALVKYWSRSQDKIRYKLGKRKRRYHPDIFVVYHDGRIFLEEVKGYIFDKRQFVKKKMMAEWTCKVRGWTYRVLFEKDLEKVE